MKNLIKTPVKYEPMGQAIFDADFNRVCDVRGWGRISYMEDPEEKQDSMGQFIADAINEKLERERPQVAVVGCGKSFLREPMFPMELLPIAFDLLFVDDEPEPIEQVVFELRPVLVDPWPFIEQDCPTYGRPPKKIECHTRVKRKTTHHIKQPVARMGFRRGNRS